MEPNSTVQNFMNAVTIYVPTAAFVVGLVVGWLGAKGRWPGAAAALVAGGVLAFLGYAGLFAWFGVFDLKNEIR